MAMLPWGVANGGGRPSYLYGVLGAARMARSLNIESISVIEFGVAGGNGLVDLESAGAMASEFFGTRISVYGFDGGPDGLPEVRDVRDAPWEFAEGDFKMDHETLAKRLQGAQLVLGDVSETVREWIAQDHDPVGFVAFDLNQFTGTQAAMTVLEMKASGLLPRVTCFFGSVLNDHIGEGAAIVDFNERNDDRKVGRNHLLRYKVPRNHRDVSWPCKIYTAHIFDHPTYAHHVSRVDGAHPSETRMKLRRA